MITRIEATNYRCFARVNVDLGEMRVFAGANGSGKTSLLDIPCLLGDLLRQRTLGEAFLMATQPRGARASTFTELVHQEKGDWFILVVEGALPQAVVTELLTSASPTVQQDEELWPRFVRYEVRLEVFNKRELHVKNEYLFLFAEKHLPPRDTPDVTVARLHGEISPHKDWHFVVSREYGGQSEFRPEAKEPGKARRAPVRSTAVPADRLALGMLGFESREQFPAARWLLDLLTAESVFFDPNWSELRKASPPGLPATLAPDGRNLPWLALRMEKEDPEGFQTWTEHVRIALPQVTKIEPKEREEDHHAYFRVTYNDRYTVTSSGLSDGTLRILALTLLPYLPRAPQLLVVEEPENGIHPRAIEAVLQGLASMHDSQVLVSSHSPIVIAQVPVEQLLAARVERDGAVVLVPGPQHPRLVDWKGEVDLGTLFAAGVLG